MAPSIARKEQSIKPILGPINLLNFMEDTVMNKISAVNSAMGFIGLSIYIDSLMPKGH